MRSAVLVNAKNLGVGGPGKAKELMIQQFLAN
jgi:hypothetical protein